MKTSARNKLTGAVIQINKGSVNDEIVVLLDGSGTRLVSVITCASTKHLGLEIGSKVVAIFKAPWVVLMADTKDAVFSARNQFPGTIVSITEGVVSAEVRVRLDGGEVITSTITMESLREMALEAGQPITAMVKASNVILGALKS